MRPRILPLLLLLIVPFSGSAQDRLVIQPLSGAPDSDAEIFFAVTEEGVQVGGDVIQEFAISGDRVTVGYKNRTEKSIFPEYRIRIYNRYGILIGHDQVESGLFGGSPKLEPGDVGGDRLHFEWVDLGEIFKHAAVGDLPDDFGMPRWLSISDSNSEVATGGADHPAAAPER